MAKKTVTELVAMTKAALVQKRAEFKDLVGQNPDTIPGAEHSKPVTVPGPDKEVRQNEALQASGYSAEGKGDDSPLTRGHALDALQPVKETPTPEPLCDDDANADRPSQKAAGAAEHANDILASIRAFQKKQAAPVAKPQAKTVAKVAADTVVKAKKKTEDALAGAGEGGEKPAEGAPTTTEGQSTGVEEAKATGDQEPSKKVAGDGTDVIELSQEVLAKIACVVLSTEEGWKLSEKLLGAAAGQEKAAEILGFVSKQAEAADAQASYAAGVALAEQHVKQAQISQMKQAENDVYLRGWHDALSAVGRNQAPATDQRKQAAIKQAVTKQAAIKEAQESYVAGAQLVDAVIADAQQKQAAAVKAAQVPGLPPGMADAAAADMGGGMPGGMPGAPEGGGMPGAPEGDSGNIEQLAAALEGVTPEDIGEALGEMVREGTITMEQAQAILDQIDSEGGEGGAGGGMEGAGGGMEGAGGPPQAAEGGEGGEGGEKEKEEED